MRRTESRIASRSSGSSVRGSITSASMPSAARRSAAASASPTIRERATIVTSPPSRATRAWPIGTGCEIAGRILLAEVEVLVLDEDHRVGIGDRADQQPGGIRGVARHHDLEPGDVGDPGLQALRVLGRAPRARAALGAQHERHPELPAGHEVGLGSRVDELVQGEREEVDEHDLQHRPLARLGRADRDAADRRLADRRVDHPLGAELLGQAGGHRVRTALGDVLADHEHVVVGPHRLGERPVERLDEGRLPAFGAGLRSGAAAAGA